MPYVTTYPLQEFSNIACMICTMMEEPLQVLQLPYCSRIFAFELFATGVAGFLNSFTDGYTFSATIALSVDRYEKINCPYASFLLN